MTNHYGYSIGPKGRVVHVGSSFARTCNAAQAALWDTRETAERAHIYRQADGYRFMGYVTYDGRFIDMRVPNRATA